MTEPELVAPDPGAAMAVPIRGATDAERAAAFAGIAAVPDAGVRAVVFFDQGKQRAVRVVVAHSPLDPATDVRYYWLGFLAATTIARPLEQAGQPIRYLEVGPGTEGHAFEALIWPERSPEEVAAVARDLAARSAAAGWEVAELRAWAGRPGRHRDHAAARDVGLLDGRADSSRRRCSAPRSGPTRAWFASRPPTAGYLAGGGSIGERGGFGRDEPYGPPRDVRPPATCTARPTST